MEVLLWKNNFNGKINEIKEHSKTCGLKQIICQCCEKEFPLIIIKQHCDNSYNEPILYNYCNQYFEYILLKEHISECPETEINCV